MLTHCRNHKQPFNKHVITQQIMFFRHKQLSATLVTKNEYKDVSVSLWPKRNMIIPVDKPLHITSAKFLDKLKSVLKVQKMGHSGTLDPLASGLMFVALGDATKEIEKYMSEDKIYEFTVRFGEVTESFDTGTPVSEVDTDQQEKLNNLTVEHIRDVIKNQFIGSIQQETPLYSAVKVNGIKLTDIAYMKDAEKRKQLISSIGKQVRDIQVFKVTVLDRQPEDDIRDYRMIAHVSKGTYIRTLGHDIAKACGFIGGHIRALRRTHISKWSLDCAWTIEELKAMQSEEVNIDQVLHKIEQSQQLDPDTRKQVVDLLLELKQLRQNL
jgi:tRNA pseudouridine55 synthase